MQGQRKKKSSSLQRKYKSRHNAYWQEDVSQKKYDELSIYIVNGGLEAEAWELQTEVHISSSEDISWSKNLLILLKKCTFAYKDFGNSPLIIKSSNDSDPVIRSFFFSKALMVKPEVLIFLTNTLK